MLLFYFTLFLLSIYTILLIVFIIGWYKVSTENNTNIHHQLSFTIIIPARNEEDNIKKCLQSIIKSKYEIAKVEIIVIDDDSEDDTYQIAHEFLSKHQCGRVFKLNDFVDTSKFNAFKKAAIQLGVQQSKNDIIIQTDADCTVNPEWLSELNKAFQNKNTQFVAAPVSFTPNRSKSLLYYFQSIDFMTMQGITAAVNTLGIGNMANGANMAYRKEAYFKAGGFDQPQEKASGDDMFLLEKIKANFPNGIYYLKAKNAIVKTQCQPDLASFFQQRIRWASKNNAYKSKLMLFQLGTIYFFNISLFSFFIYSIFQPVFISYAVIILLIKIIIELILLFPVARFYHKISELYFFPLLQIPHILYIIIAGFLGQSVKYNWKSRKVY